VHFNLLGALEVLDGSGNVIDVGGTQPRTVLAVLLAAAGRVVPADTLVDVIWGDSPPPSASGTLQTYVSRLRRALDPDRARGQGGILRTESSGYRIVTDGATVDFVRFEALADEARDKLGAGDLPGAREALVAAEGLWRGPALAEFRDHEFAVGLAARLEARRLAAVEDRIAVDLALGRHAALVGELAELVTAHPMQEGLRASLALALYRSGRQADALRAIDDARRTLVDELGVDPGRPLRDLEAAILRHDPSLDLEPVAAAAPPAPVVRTDQAVAPEAAMPIVGRAAEVREVIDALREAETATRAVIIEGEPGIGKTRLAEEMASEARRRGARVLWSRAFEGGTAPSLWPWLPPLRALAELAPAGVELAPDLRQLIAPAGDQPPGTAVDAARYAVFEAVTALLSSCAAERPVVLVLDDIQWADVASLELLRSIADRLHDVPVLLVCIVRELEVGRNDAVVDALAALTRRTGTRRIRLRGLTADATAELVRRTTGDDPSPETVRAIQQRAEGNPFFATELARLLAGGEGLGDIPSGVRDVVRRRLAHLPQETVQLLHIAAVAGREVDIGLLTRASGEDFDTCLDRLEPALVQRLLVIDPEQPSVYRFAHALVREVVADDMSTLTRARLHLKVADALPEDDDTIEIIAEHLWAAVPIGVGTRAADALDRASKVAIRRVAYASAQDLLERAVQLRRTAGSSPEHVAAEALSITNLVSVIGARTGHASLVGSPLVARGQQLADAAGMPLERLLLVWVEWAGLDLSNRSAEAHPSARELLDMAAAEPDLPLASVLGHTAYGISCWHEGRIDEASEHLDIAAALAPTAVDATHTPLLSQLDQIRISMAFSVYIHDLRGDLDDPERRYDEVVAVVPGDVFWELLVMNFAASGALSLGDVERSIRASERGIAADPEGVSQFWSMALRCYLGAALYLRGDIDRALEVFDPAWDAYRAVGLRTNGSTWLACKAHGLAAVGRLDDAKAAVAEAWHELEAYRDLYAESTILLAEAALLHASGDDATNALQRAVDVAVAQGSHAVAARAAREAEAMGIALRGH
jgi:DNA-binding SARP family transcriptional activator/tetratricopeptide (TPR) repeat protein